MKRQSLTKSGSAEKKDDNVSEKPPRISQVSRVSRVSVYDPRARSRSRVSSDFGAHGQGFAWRASGKGKFKTPKYQNSYRLEPYLPFKFEFSDKLLVQTMTQKLENLRYDPETCVELCQSMAGEIREKLYKTDYDRVKYVVSMTIIENAGQSLVVGNGRLWDSERDTYSVFVFDNPFLYAVGLVVALNYE
ncbi:tctex1 domain-containing protein 1 [Copidosoma floridanum]|uniref:tctex1 domain-containing protein 1 n=1 Tax=Copidosoma floridanum TaxID=29053 RepID=UPI0006C95AB1|nr:tctex1 domain-containing protein 1 [Copidosoma floridanum]